MIGSHILKLKKKRKRIRIYIWDCYANLIYFSESLQIISPYHLYLNPKLVVKQYQFWRLITNFLYFRKMGKFHVLLRLSVMKSLVYCCAVRTMLCSMLRWGQCCQGREAHSRRPWCVLDQMCLARKGLRPLVRLDNIAACYC